MSTSRWTEFHSARSTGFDNRARVLMLRVQTGTGIECAYCRRPISPEAVEYEVEAFVQAKLRVLHFHRVCQHLWESGTS